MVHVIIHNSVSADGSIDGFNVDLGLHYQLASRFGADVHLAGSDTILAAEMDTQNGVDDSVKSVHDDPHDRRPLLAVVDSRGSVRSWALLRQAPHWRDRMVALCSRRTPADYLDRLAARHVDCIVAGEEHVDLGAALQEMERRYNAKRVLVDSGGTLNGVLLRSGLVDEVSLLIHPCLVDGSQHRSMFRPPEVGDAVGLRFVAVEQCPGGTVWLRYSVVTPAHPKEAA